MTSTATSTSSTRRADALHGGVVAGLVNDGSARAVAEASLAYAVANAMTVSFVHVVSAAALRHGGDDVGDTTFAAVLGAMRGRGRLRCGFEVVHGEASRALVELSRDASLLVIGGGPSSSHDHIADYVRRYAACEVLTVDTGEATEREGSPRSTTSG